MQKHPSYLVFLNCLQIIWNLKTNFGKDYPGLALPWASRSTVGTPSLTRRVKSDCSMLQNFWNAIFLMTGGSWWWSPIMIHLFRRLLLSSGFYKFEVKNLVIHVTVFNISQQYASYLNQNVKHSFVQYLKQQWDESFDLKNLCWLLHQNVIKLKSAKNSQRSFIQNKHPYLMKASFHCYWRKQMINTVLSKRNDWRVTVHEFMQQRNYTFRQNTQSFMPMKINETTVHIQHVD